MSTGQVLSWETLKSRFDATFGVEDDPLRAAVFQYVALRRMAAAQAVGVRVDPPRVKDLPESVAIERTGKFDHGEIVSDNPDTRTRTLAHAAVRGSWQPCRSSLAG